LNLRSPAQLTERELLKLALQRPELVAPAFDAYGEDEFTAEPYVAVRRAVEQAGGVTYAADDYLARVRDAAPDDTVRGLVTELAVEAIRAKNVDEVYAGVQLVQVRLRAVERRVKEVQASLVRLGAGADPDHLAAVQNELWVLEQYGRSLKDRGAAAL
ncbi:DNA primase, partial [Streptomyces sp. UNOC14_S4]|nr:DNA primase [Streptomyces sp. UNOC14_S4]